MNKSSENELVPADRTGTDVDAGVEEESALSSASRESAYLERTDDTTDTVKEYLRAIGQHALLDRKEELELSLAVERWRELDALREQFADEPHGKRAPVKAL